MKKAVIKLRWRKIRSEQEVIGKDLLKSDIFMGLLKGTSLAECRKEPPREKQQLAHCPGKNHGKELGLLRSCKGASRAGVKETSRGVQRGGGSAKQEVSLGGSDPGLQRETPTWSISAYAQDASSIFFFLSLFIFLWSIIALQSCTPT